MLALIVKILKAMFSLFFCRLVNSNMKNALVLFSYRMYVIHKLNHIFVGLITAVISKIHYIILKRIEHLPCKNNLNFKRERRPLHSRQYKFVTKLDHAFWIKIDK